MNMHFSKIVEFCWICILTSVNHTPLKDADLSRVEQTDRQNDGRSTNSDEAAVGAEVSLSVAVP